LRAFRLLFVCLAAAAFVAAPALARAPDGLTLEYQIIRNGSEIGRHKVRFAHDGDNLVVETEVRIEVNFAFITLFRYALDGVETWRHGRLVELRTTADDDGDQYAVHAVADGDSIVVNAGGDTWTAPATAMPSSLWHPDLARGSLLIGVEQGERMVIAAEDVGRENIPARGGEVSATHLVVSGELERDLWYDDDGILVHLRLVARDGSEIDYVLE
jgi:hypothetical protein